MGKRSAGRCVPLEALATLTDLDDKGLWTGAAIESEMVA